MRFRGQDGQRRRFAGRSASCLSVGLCRWSVGCFGAFLRVGQVMGRFGVFFIWFGGGDLVAAFNVNTSPMLDRRPRYTYLDLFKLFRGSLFSCWRSSCAIATGSTGFGFVLSACSSNKSCIFLFLSACGIRLTRISRRDRRPCACKAYCARSFRARSVTT